MYFILLYQRLTGGENVSKLPLKDNAVATFLDQNPPFEPRPKWNSAFDKNLSRSMARHRQHCHQATSERQIAVAPLGLIAGQLGDLIVAHPDSRPALQFPSAIDVTIEP